MIFLKNMLRMLWVLASISCSVCHESWTVEDLSGDTKSDVKPITSPKNLQVVSAKSDIAEDYSLELIEDEEPYFDAAMLSSYIAYLNKTAVMTCIVHAVKNEKSVSWIRSKGLRILTVGRYTYTTDLRYEALHAEGSSEWILRIKSIEQRDEGQYECQIATKPIKSFGVHLKVVEPYLEILGSPDIYVNRASMINLTCIVHHAPNPPDEIIWMHENETISYTSTRGGVSVVEERGETTTSFLLLQNAQKTDSGRFTCLPAGMEPIHITLHVLEEGEYPAAMQTNSASRCREESICIFIVFMKYIFYIYS